MKARRRALLALLASAAARAQAAPLVAATWNLRLNTAADGPDAWPLRRDAVGELIVRHGIDLLATQEAFVDQLEDLDARLPGFARAGVGRDDGARAGEHAAIYWRESRLEALARGDFWLSETPHKPSKGWDARCCHRLCSWVRLRERATGRQFVAFSAHFDHEGVVARRESAKLVLARLHAIAGALPALLLGDLNATPQSEPVGLLLAGGLRDARAASQTPAEGPLGSFNGFALDAPLRDRIDYILLHGPWRVQRYRALDERRANGRYPSDHLPILAHLVLE